jgi:hypothetical protein
MAVISAAADTTIAWFTLAGALGGVALTSIATIATTILNHRWQARSAARQRLEEHARQLRQERLEAYAGYWRSWNRFNHELRTVTRAVSGLVPQADSSGHARDRIQPDVVEQAWMAELEWLTAADTLLLLGGPAVIDATNAHVEATRRKVDAVWKGGWAPDEKRTFQTLYDAMRAEVLGSQAR